MWIVKKNNVLLQFKTSDDLKWVLPCQNEPYLTDLEYNIGMKSNKNH